MWGVVRKTQQQDNNTNFYHLLRLGAKNLILIKPCEGQTEKLQLREVNELAEVHGELMVSLDSLTPETLL